MHHDLHPFARGDDSDGWFTELLRMECERQGIDDPEQGVDVSEEMVGEVFNTSETLYLEWLRANTPRMLEEHENLGRGFESRLFALWGPALNGLKALHTAAVEMAEMFCAGWRKDGSKERLKVNTLLHLHARGCLTCGEVLHLLRGGFAAGANARWRTLHEIEVTAAFLANQKDDTFERYQKHAAFEDRRLIRELIRHPGSPGVEPPSSDELKAIEDECRQLKKGYGSAFAGQCGWAAVALGDNEPSFSKLEAAVERGALRRFYSDACRDVHAGVSSIFKPLGLRGSRNGTMLAGPSNAELGEPGFKTARSITQLTWTLLHLRRTMTNCIAMSAMAVFMKEAEQAFVHADEEWQRVADGAEEPSV